MEQRATIFVEAMVVVAIIGVLAFLIAWLVRSAQTPQAAGGAAGAPVQSPRWYEFTLALLLLAAIAAFAIWLISSGRQWAWGETFEDWRSDTRAIIFAAVMVALGVIGLVVSFAYTLAQSTRTAVSAAAGRVGGGESAHDRAGGRRDAGGAADSRPHRPRGRDRAAVLDRARAGRPARP